MERERERGRALTHVTAVQVEGHEEHDGHSTRLGLFSKLTRWKTDYTYLHIPVILGPRAFRPTQVYHGGVGGAWDLNSAHVVLTLFLGGAFEVHG